MLVLASCIVHESAVFEQAAKTAMKDMAYFAIFHFSEYDITNPLCSIDGLDHLVKHS